MYLGAREAQRGFEVALEALLWGSPETTLPALYSIVSFLCQRTMRAVDKSMIILIH